MQHAIRAVLLTDLVDSTRLSEELGDERMSAVWAAHDDLARGLLPTHRGTEIDKTDGFLLLFEVAEDALAYATAYHAALRDLSATLGVRLAARAGLHVGDVILRESPPEQVARGAKPLEVDGLAKPTAARIMSIARGGQTLVSASAAPGLSGRLVSHGSWRMKGLREPLELWERDAPGAVLLPPEEGEKVYRVVQDGDLWLPVREVPHNLPRERDLFVGRAADLLALAASVQAGPLTTVIGPGGTGKTRLVRRFGWGWLGDFPGGAWFCDLAEARSSADVVAAVAAALGEPLDPNDPVGGVGRALRRRGRCLVLLDNFEQVVRDAPSTLGRWLDHSREATFVVTSREVLGLGGERLLPLAPLPPDTDGIALFEARARAQDPRFAVGDDNRADVSGIVAQLDGLPLAIELAAARVRALPPALLRARLRDRFRLLTAARGGSNRQATLRATIDWSWDLLTPWERAALAQCAAFEGGFDLEAAEVVLDLDAWPEAPWVMDVVQALVDKSLLRAWEPGATEPRYETGTPLYGMFVSIQEYAIERLDALGTEVRDATWRRHAEHYTARCATLSEKNEPGADARLRLEVGNLRAAVARAVLLGETSAAVRGLVAAPKLGRTFGLADLALTMVESVRATALSPEQRLVVGQIWVVVACDRVSAEVVLAELRGLRTLAEDTGDERRRVDAVLRLAGFLTAVTHAYGQADDLVSEIEPAARALDDPLLLARVLVERHRIASFRGRSAEDHHFAEALAAVERAGLPAWPVRHGAAVAALQAGDLARARGLWETTVAEAEAAQDADAEASSLLGLAALAMRTAAPDALARAEHVRTRCEQTGNQRFVAVCTAMAAVAHARGGAHGAAEAALAEAERLATTMRHSWELTMVWFARAAARALAGDAAGARAAFTEGEAHMARSSPEHTFRPVAVEALEAAGVRLD